MCDAFDIDDKKPNCCRSNVLQNNLTQFGYGRLRAFELHLGYNLGKIPHVAFLLVVANLVLATSKHQTQN
jgi:ribosomal protein L11 methylase PrmA